MLIQYIMNSKLTHLITPFIDDGHVDIINEDSHLASARWTIGTAHALLHVTLNCSLDENKVTV